MVTIWLEIICFLVSISALPLLGSVCPPRSAAVLSDTIIINDEADNHKHSWKKQENAAASGYSSHAWVVYPFSQSPLILLKISL